MLQSLRVRFLDFLSRHFWSCSIIYSTAPWYFCQNYVWQTWKTWTQNQNSVQAATKKQFYPAFQFDTGMLVNTGKCSFKYNAEICKTLARERRGQKRLEIILKHLKWCCKPRTFQLSCNGCPLTKPLCIWLNIHVWPAT